VRYLVWFFVVAWLLGSVAMWSLISVFGAVSGESVDPSQKARILAEGISEAMNAFAFSTGLLLLGGVVMLVLTWKYPWAAKPPEVPKDPPYR
jgi:hypothetical protein